MHFHQNVLHFTVLLYVQRASHDCNPIENAGNLLHNIAWAREPDMDNTISPYHHLNLARVSSPQVQHLAVADAAGLEVHHRHLAPALEDHHLPEAAPPSESPGILQPAEGSFEPTHHVHV